MFVTHISIKLLEEGEEKEGERRERGVATKQGFSSQILKMKIDC